MKSKRDKRQSKVLAWAAGVFGRRCAYDVRERVARLVEEVVELAQAEGMAPEEISGIVGHVFSKPPGEPAQEVGGVCVTLLCYCEAVDLSADEMELREITLITARTREHFVARQNAKADAGIARRSE